MEQGCLTVTYPLDWSISEYDLDEEEADMNSEVDGCFPAADETQKVCGGATASLPW